MDLSISLIVICLLVAVAGAYDNARCRCRQGRDATACRRQAPPAPEAGDQPPPRRAEKRRPECND